MPRMLALAVSLLAGLTACQQPITGPAESQIGSSGARGNASSSALDSQYVLTTRGGYVLSSPPPGLQISVGSKLVRRADAADVPGKVVDGSN